MALPGLPARRASAHHTTTGAIVVHVAGAESAIHGGRAGRCHIFDTPERGAFEVGGPWERALDGLAF